jgi:hypothetical protein
VAVVQDVEEGEASIFGDGGRGRGVDQVPGGADVGVRNVEGVVKGFKGLDYTRGLLMLAKYSSILKTEKKY